MYVTQNLLNYKQTVSIKSIASKHCKKSWDLNCSLSTEGEKRLSFLATLNSSVDAHAFLTLTQHNCIVIVIEVDAVYICFHIIHLTKYSEVLGFD